MVVHDKESSSNYRIGVWVDIITPLLEFLDYTNFNHVLKQKQMKI